MRIITGPEGIQGSAEWLEFRKGKIGASMAPIIMGVSPWKTPLQLFRELSQEITKEPSYSMQRGTSLEPKAREWVNGILKKEFVPVVVQHENLDEWIASLDGYDGESILEIKCPGQEDHLLAISGIIPAHYYPQLQHQMFVTGIPFCYYCSYDGKNGVILKCYSDLTYQDFLYNSERRFLGFLRDNEPPEPSDMDLDDIVDPEALEEAEEYIEFCKSIESMEKERTSIREKLISRCSRKNSRIGDIYLSKISRKGNVDYSKIPELKKIDLEQYRRPSSEFYTISLGDKYD